MNGILYDRLMLLWRRKCPLVINEESRLLGMLGCFDVLVTAPFVAVKVSSAQPALGRGGSSLPGGSPKSWAS